MHSLKNGRKEEVKDVNENNMEEFIDKQDEKVKDIPETLENKAFVNYKTAMIIRLKLQMINQEIKYDMGKGLLLDLQKRVSKALKKFLRKESLNGHSIL